MKTLFQSVRFIFVMTLITGVAYPLLMTMFGKTFYASKAEGDFLKNKEGTTVGSKWIAQNFTKDEYFHPRPSAINYNASSSSGSNLGPTSADLLKVVTERKSGEDTDTPMLFASGSGLDPHILLRTAEKQIPRVSKARGMEESVIYAMVLKHVEPRQWGFLGEPRINVLMLNLDLDNQ